MANKRKLGRHTSGRLALLRGLTTALLEHGQITTTVTRAKEIRSTTEKMITLGKKNTLHTRRRAMQFIYSETVVKKLFDEIAPKYAERNGGYTRILRTDERRGDAAPMAIIQLV